MPYKDKEKQRAAARESARRKAKKKEGPKTVSATLTWAQINEIDERVDAVETYADCVEIASNLSITLREGRMTVAALALRACEIKRGGNKRNPLTDGITLKQFAAEVHISNRTLNEWIQVKKQVIDKIPPQKRKGQVIDYYSCQTAIRRAARNGSDVLEELESITEQGSNLRYVENAYRYAQSLNAHLKRCGKVGMEDIHIAACLELKDMLAKVFK